MVEKTPHDDPVDQAFAAYLHACDTGECSREEFLEKFPDIANELRELIDAADMIVGRMTMSGIRVQDDAGLQTTAPGADTIGDNVGGQDSGGDPAITLPMPNRGKDDPGPTLPYDIGDYVLQEVIGRGGMGVVYLAKQHYLDRYVAVKMIRSGMLAGEAEVRRFYTEAQAAARLHHPGIVSVHQFGQRKGHHFFSMEFIEGTDLQRVINDGQLDIQDAARYVRDVALAIDHAHQKDVLHRDVKPANVLIDNSDRVHITDFGLAKNLDADSSVTGSGAAIGTPHYMAPEQAGGHSDRACKQSDVYSMGAILFACVTGRPPIVADSVMQTLMQVVHNPPPPMRSIRPGVPIDLETIVAKCLEKKPEKRYQTAHDLAQELNAFMEGRPISARPRSAAIKTWHWMEGVPIIGALMGKRVLETSTAHLRVQALGLLVLLTLPLVFVGYTVWKKHYSQAMPTSIEIGGGVTDGIYNRFSRSFARRLGKDNPVITQIFPSNGSLDNRDRLISGEVDLAPVEASVVASDQLCVVAPLFYEAGHVMARTDSDINSIADLNGKRVAVGPAGSGSKRTAELVFNSMQLDKDAIVREVIPWEDLGQPEAPQAAVICIGRGSDLILKLLRSEEWKIIPIQESVKVALGHPILLPMTIEASDYPGMVLPSEGVATVGTTAFLASRYDAPGELIRAALTTLYETPYVIDGLIPSERAAEWQGLAFHPESQSFYRSLREEK